MPPTEGQVARICQKISYMTLVEVFNARNGISRKENRRIGRVFQGVGTTLRALEFGAENGDS